MSKSDWAAKMQREWGMQEREEVEEAEGDEGGAIEGERVVEKGEEEEWARVPWA